MQRIEVRGGTQPQDEAYRMQIEVESPDFEEVRPGVSCMDMQEEPLETGQYRVQGSRGSSPAPGAAESSVREAEGESPAPAADTPEPYQGDLLVSVFPEDVTLRPQEAAHVPV